MRILRKWSQNGEDVVNVQTRDDLLFSYEYIGKM